MANKKNTFFTEGTNYETFDFSNWANGTSVKFQGTYVEDGIDHDKDFYEGRTLGFVLNEKKDEPQGYLVSFYSFKDEKWSEFRWFTCEQARKISLLAIKRI